MTQATDVCRRARGAPPNPRSVLLARISTMVCLLLGFSCQERPSIKGQTAKPVRLNEPGGAGDAAPEGRDALFRVERVPTFGMPIPRDARRIELGQSQRPSVRPGERVLLVAGDSTYLAQAAPVLAWLDDSRAEPWLLHAGGERAFLVKLRDEVSFQRWLGETKPGRVRIIQREDGLELQTNVGKLPGADPNGPTLPTRGGQLNIAGLRRALARVKARFGLADEICVVPSYGTEVAKIAEVLSGCFEEDTRPAFSNLCWVYPRPPPQPQVPEK